MIEQKVVKFLFVGILNTLVYYILYGLFLYLNVGYKMAVVYATVIGVFINFKTFGKYVFNNVNNNLIFIFILTYIFLYFVNIFFINIFEYMVHNYYISGFLAIFPYAIVSYYLNSRYVFKQKESV